MVKKNARIGLLLISTLFGFGLSADDYGFDCSGILETLREAADQISQSKA